MNNTESQTKGLQDSISWLNETANQGKEFVIEQAPLYAQEYLSFTRFTYAIDLSFCVLICSASVSAIILLIKKRKSKLSFFEAFDNWWNGEEGSGAYYFLIIVSTIAFLLSLAITGLHVGRLLKVIVAPRVVLLEHVSSLIN